MYLLFFFHSHPNPYSFDCYLIFFLLFVFFNLVLHHLVSFCFVPNLVLIFLIIFFYHFSNWILFSISSYNIWSWFIFMSNFILILLITICFFLNIFLLLFSSNFIPKCFFIEDFTLLFFRFFFYGISSRLLTRVVDFKY